MTKELEKKFSESEQEKKKRELIEKRMFLEKEIARMEGSYNSKPLEVIMGSGGINMDSFHMTEEDDKKVRALYNELHEVELELDELEVPYLNYEDYSVLLGGTEKIKDFYFKIIPKTEKKIEELRLSGAGQDEIEKQTNLLQVYKEGLIKAEAEVNKYKELKAKKVN